MENVDLENCLFEELERLGDRETFTKLLKIIGETTGHEKQGVADIMRAIAKRETGEQFDAYEKLKRQIEKEISQEYQKLEYLEPLPNQWRESDELSFEEYAKARREGRVTGDFEKRVTICSDNPREQWTFVSPR